MGKKHKSIITIRCNNKDGVYLCDEDCDLAKGSPGWGIRCPFHETKEVRGKPYYAYAAPGPNCPGEGKCEVVKVEE